MMNILFLLIGVTIGMVIKSYQLRIKDYSKNNSINLVKYYKDTVIIRSYHSNDKKFTPNIRQIDILNQAQDCLEEVDKVIRLFSYDAKISQKLHQIRQELFDLPIEYSPEKAMVNVISCQASVQSIKELETQKLLS